MDGIIFNPAFRDYSFGARPEKFGQFIYLGGGECIRGVQN